MEIAHKPVQTFWGSFHSTVWTPYSVHNPIFGMQLEVHRWGKWGTTLYEQINHVQGIKQSHNWYRKDNRKNKQDRICLIVKASHPVRSFDRYLKITVLVRLEAIKMDADRRCSNDWYHAFWMWVQIRSPSVNFSFECPQIANLLFENARCCFIDKGSKEEMS